MRDINLLPKKQKQKRLALSVITYITFGFLIMLMSVAGFAVTLTTIRVTINDKINNYIGKREGIEVKIKSFQAIESEVSTTNQALNRAIQVLDQQLIPSPIITTISNRVSDKIILTSISVIKVADLAFKSDPTKTVTQIALIGSAKTRTDVIDFKRGLEESGAFENVFYTIGTGATTTTSSAALVTSTPTESDDITFTINTASKNKDSLKP